MLHMKRIFVLYILLAWTNAMALDSSTRECVDKGNCTGMEVESSTIQDEKNTMPFKLDEVYYSIINSPVVCKHNERLDFRGICRQIQ